MSEEKNLVVKSNDLVESKYKLSLREQKIVLYLISQIKKDDEDFKTYTLSIKDFSKMMGLKGYPKYTEIRQITDQLQRKLIKMKVGEKIVSVNWLSLVIYNPDEGSIDFRFDPYLKPYLLELRKNFTSYQLKNVLNLNSTYSIRIYEVLKQFELIKARLVSLGELREMIGATDVYPIYGNFKQRVLLPAQEELKKKTDIAFDFEEIKSGRKVDKIKFTIFSTKLKEEVALVDYADFDAFETEIELFANMRGIQVDKATMDAWRAYGESKVLEIVHKLKDKTDLVNPIAYIDKVLENMPDKMETLSEDDAVRKAVHEFILQQGKSKKAPAKILFEEKLKDHLTTYTGISEEEAQQIYEEQGESIYQKIRSTIKSRQLVIS